MRNMGGVRRSSAALMVLGFVLLAAGCSQMSNPTYDVGDLGCASAPVATVKVIQEKLTADGNLRNAKTVPAADGVFVSAELHLRTDDKDAKGDILTWITDDLDGDQFFSVDVNAREESTWPAADITVTEPGARESRACAQGAAGKSKARVQCELDQSAGEIPADRECDEL